MFFCLLCHFFAHRVEHFFFTIHVCWFVLFYLRRAFLLPYMLSCLRCAFLFASHFFNLLVFGFFFAFFFFRVDPFGSQYPSPQLHCTVSGVLTEFQLVST